MNENLENTTERGNQNITGESMTENQLSPKSKVVAALLNFFLGYLGIHRFYIGKIGTGVIMLILNVLGAATTFIFVGWALIVVAGIWDLVDFIKIICGKMTDSNGKIIK